MTYRQRKKCILLLTCVGAGPKFFLPFSNDFSERYYIRDVVFHDLAWLPAISARVDDELEDTSLLVYHEVDCWPTISKEQRQSYESIVARIPSNVQKISIPQPHFHPFWPFHCGESRNADRTAPPNRYGRSPYFHHGDSFVLRLLHEGISPAEVVRRYVDANLADEIDLDRDLRRGLALLERHDRASTIKITDYVAGTFRHKKLFSNVNHMNSRLLFYISNEILKLVGCQTLSEDLFERTTEMMDGEVPIHPSIGRHHNIPYIKQTSRYLIDHIKYSTFAEYIDDYVHLRDGLVS